MDLLYISPEFPPNYGQFIRSLDRRGVAVWAIGEADFHDMPDDLRSAIRWYVRADLRSEAAVAGAVDRLLNAKTDLGLPACFELTESHNEQWLTLEAFINESFDIPGLRPADLPRLKRKSAMKQVFRDNGLTVARGETIRNAEHAMALAETIGYPLILKPDEGVGAGGIHKIMDTDQLHRILKDLSEPYLMEEFIDGHIVSYDGLTDWSGNPIFENSLSYGDGVLEYVNGKDTFFYVNREIPEALAEMGRRLVAAFDIRRKFFHFEFFEKDGEYLPIEINCRPPGGAILDMMNYSVDDDLYDAYARMIVHGTAQVAMEKKYYCAYVGRRDRNYARSHPEILKRCGEKLAEYGENPVVFQGAMCRYRYIVRSPAEEEVLAMARDILELAPA